MDISINRSSLHYIAFPNTPFVHVPSIRTLHQSGHLANQDILLIRTLYQSGHLANQDIFLLIRTPCQSGYFTNQDTFPHGPLASRCETFHFTFAESRASAILRPLVILDLPTPDDNDREHDVGFTTNKQLYLHSSGCTLMLARLTSFPGKYDNFSSYCSHPDVDKLLIIINTTFSVNAGTHVIIGVVIRIHVCIYLQ